MIADPRTATLMVHTEHDRTPEDTMSAPTRLSRPVRLVGAVATALVAGVAVTFLPLGFGLILGAVAGMAAAAFHGSGTPGPDTPDNSSVFWDAPGDGAADGGDGD